MKYDPEKVTIRFTCDHCGRPIAVVSDQRATAVNCPHCEHSQPIPEESPVTPPPANRIGQHESQYPGDGILLSRRQMIGVGAILLFTGIGAFGLGWLCGLSSRRSPLQQQISHCSLTGTISGLNSRAAVFILPADSRPEIKTDLETTSVAELLRDTRLLTEIRSFGGELASTDQSGRFAASLPSSDDYFFLILADENKSSPTADTRTLAELGRYFLHGDRILRHFAWSWSRETVQDGAKVSIQL